MIDLRLVSRLVDREIGPDAPDEAFFAEEELFYGASGRVACFPSWRGGARTFYDAGMALARYGDWSLGFFASDGFVDESEPGHTHNDKLSFTLGFKGVPFFVDPRFWCLYARSQGAQYPSRYRTTLDVAVWES